MTYEARYSVRAAGRLSHPAADLTLYEACKVLEQAAADGLLTDATHVRRSDRCVAFYSEWHSTVRAMFGALPAERAVLEAWA